MSSFLKKYVRFRSGPAPKRPGERGATAAEYAIIIAIVALGIVAALGTFRTAIVTALEDAAGEIAPPP